MLKALELVGFKSFADKTRFDFPAGITVVVGPNGSGKSNVVDAIKWVLGEQSARSLRGKEMADVIFKGSGSGQRKPANMAEATIIFDNSERLIDLDGAEVQVTRRVYRGGEGEYLINGQPSRLKDIKQLFRGTGVGTDAYSLIEQGKVDSLLQASSDDRRAIFEEAAGISRFKAKKLEAERRLARVEQNLLRLSDIVDEVDGRLRKLRSQAAKARRYKEISDRLQSLRTQAGQSDWIELTARLHASQEIYDGWLKHSAGVRDQLREVTDRCQQLEQTLENCNRDLREAETAGQRSRERYAVLRSSNSVHAARMGEISAECERAMRRIQEMRHQARLDAKELQSIEDELERAVAEMTAHQEQWRRLEDVVASDMARLAELRPRCQQLQQQHQAIQQSIADNERQSARRQASWEAAQERLQDAQARRTELLPALQAAEDDLRQRQQQMAAAQDAVDRYRRQLEEQHCTWQESQRHLTQLRSQLTAVHERRIAVGERVKVLEEFQLRHEGVSAGVQAVLQQCGPEARPPFDTVHGIVADLIEVRDGDHAHLISLALADRAQHVVVTGSQMIDYLMGQPLDLPGRVGFIRVPSALPPTWSSTVSMEGQPGVIDRADRLVLAAPEFANLVQWLLGDTWIVDSLDSALRYSKQSHVPIRFVTQDGELLERDGRLIIGPPETSLQLFSRRAELRDLRSELQQLQAEHARQLAQLQQTDAAAQAHQADVDRVQAMDRETTAELAKSELAVEGAERLVRSMSERLRDINADECTAAETVTESSAALTECTVQNQHWSDQLRSLASEWEAAQHAERTADAELVAARQDAAAHEVLVHAGRTQCASLQGQLTRAQEAQLTRQHERQRLLQDSLRARQRLEESEGAMLAHTTESSQLAIDIEVTGKQAAILSAQRQEQANLLHQLHHESRQLHDALHHSEQQLHAAELDTSRLRLERDALASRLQEDYGIDLQASRHVTSVEEIKEREEVDREIVDLRRKLTQLGSVNMDALAELTDLESRYEHLSSQYRDLVQAKSDLERIIQKINADSRKIYADTLEAVRANFQILFRKVFGGGRADIVLEADKDLLESGIDIVATPPGKHSLNLSLLSGGERALTAVTLLLALFQYRPSPFCVLDEVDGPLDEANIGRFVGVLKEFLQWTRFVVVTHSKKTMTAANTLYGVTMQESGVSKRVSVRFEDVNEQGEILRSQNDEGGDGERGAA